MKQFLLGLIAVTFICVFLANSQTTSTITTDLPELPEDTSYHIAGIVRPHDTLEGIFIRHSLDRGSLHGILKSAEDSYNLSRLSVGNVYEFRIDKDDNSIQSIRYTIDDMSYVNIVRTQESFKSEKVVLEPEVKLGSLYITIRDNLMHSMPSSHREYMQLALQLSEIFAWDIDFSSDIRNGDTIKIIVEEIWIGNAFKGYGNILAVEFMNNGKLFSAYRFAYDGRTGYFDNNGRSLRKTLLRSPLKFSHISSGYSTKRLHPILRIYRPHLGVDYAARPGTPVSSAGDGTVKFSGYKGQNGRMVKIRHKGGFETYYGHLSRIPKKIRKGRKVSQGDIIGYVGTTGLSTGPHLDYRIKKKGRFVNPLTVRLPSGAPVPGQFMADFRRVVDSFHSKFAALLRPYIALSLNKRAARL